MASATKTADHVAATIRASSTPVVAQTTSLQKKLAEWDDIQDKIKQAVANAPNIVKLNVGGAIFETSKDTLLRVKGSYFHGLLKSGTGKPNVMTNAYFLDMDPTLFRRVLIFLRTGTMMPANGLSKVERDELKTMMEYLKLRQPGVPFQSFRWDDSVNSAQMTLSNDLRTVQMVKSPISRGVIATEALEGTIRIRVDEAHYNFFLGVCPLAAFDCNSSHNTSECCYRYESSGRVQKDVQVEDATQDSSGRRGHNPTT